MTQTLDPTLFLPEPQPLRFESGVSKLVRWQIRNEQGGASLEQIKEPDGKVFLHIRATESTMASWRTRVLLEAGRYRFEGLARANGIVGTKDEKKGEGAGLRISGSQQPRPNKLTGDAPLQQLTYEFEAAAPSDEVELVCELRATRGEVWFDLNSLQLVRIK